jgi:enoyl-CoA hydratase
MDVTGYETLLLAQNGPVLTVTLNRPELRNATNRRMEIELCRVFDAANHDPAVQVLVVTGAGDVFCAGGDFEYIRQNIAEPSKAWDAGQRGKQIVFSLLDCIKPVIAKINGHAIGFGATLALFCDITFAAEHAKIGDPHVSIGLVAGDGGAVIWPQLVGYARAKEHLFTGEPLLAPEAARIGLINHAVPKGELDGAVDAYVAKLLSMPPRALQWTKASVNIGLKQLAHSIMDASMAYELLSVTSEDHREAMAALKEKRKPTFTGK